MKQLGIITKFLTIFSYVIAILITVAVLWGLLIALWFVGFIFL